MTVDDETIIDLEPAFVLKLARTYGKVLEEIELARLTQSEQVRLRDEVAKHMMDLVTQGVRDARRLRDATAAYAKRRLD